MDQPPPQQQQNIDMSAEEWPAVDGELYNYFSEWRALLLRRSSQALHVMYVWKFLAFLPVPLAVVSWALGSTGLAKTSSSTGSSSSIALLIIGACTLFIDRLKARKYLVVARQRSTAYNDAAQCISYQLALHPTKRKPPAQLLDKLIRTVKSIDTLGDDVLHASND